MTIRRVTLSLARQTIAVHVTDNLGLDDVVYVYADHLGSVTALADSGGALVPDSLAFYLPFGDWRTEPEAGVTDRGYTGHVYNNIGDGVQDLDLIFMGARYHLVPVGLIPYGGSA